MVDDITIATAAYILHTKDSLQNSLYFIYRKHMTRWAVIYIHVHIMKPDINFGGSKYETCATGEKKRKCKLTL
jgi:hypothetical protein